MLVQDCPVGKDEWTSEIADGNGSIAVSESNTPHLDVEVAGRWEGTVRKLVEFLSLDDDWDGLGAKAASRELLASAVGLAYLLNERVVDPPQRVVPGVVGSVIFEWQLPDGSYGEVEVVRPLYAEVMLVEPGQPAKHWTFPTI
ncbi:MAG TPA: hypothetical protein VND64_15045 [Pirellulales bacterium]|nr:hypothetical protein [Pirellulales bacterium]